MKPTQKPPTICQSESEGPPGAREAYILISAQQVYSLMASTLVASCVSVSLKTEDSSSNIRYEYLYFLFFTIHTHYKIDRWPESFPLLEFCVWATVVTNM